MTFTPSRRSQAVVEEHAGILQTLCESAIDMTVQGSQVEAELVQENMTFVSAARLCGHECARNHCGASICYC